MIATGSEAATVAKRILDQHIPPLVFGGFNVTRDGAVEILITGQETLARVGVALKFDRQGQFTDRWAGNVDDIHVTLRLDIPRGVFPPRQRDGVAA